MPSDKTNVMPASKLPFIKTTTDFFNWLLQTLQDPDDAFCELTPISRNEYRYFACRGPKALEGKELPDPRVDDRYHGRTFRFLIQPTDEMGADFRIKHNHVSMDRPGFQHHARVTFCDDGKIVITHVFAESERAYAVLPYMHQFCWDGAKMDHKAFQDGFVRLGGRTVVSARDAVDIFHQMHLCGKDKYFERSVREVDLDTKVNL